MDSDVVQYGMMWTTFYVTYVCHHCFNVTTLMVSKVLCGKACTAK